MSPMPRGHEIRPYAERFWSKVDHRGVSLVMSRAGPITGRTATPSKQEETPGT